jgi:peptide/nickel transport system ATP-binding protein
MMAEPASRQSAQKDAAAPIGLQERGHALLAVENLQTFFFTRQGVVKAVDDMTFSLGSAETLAIVGESGCGKSVTALSLMPARSRPARSDRRWGRYAGRQ